MVDAPIGWNITPEDCQQFPGSAYFGLYLWDTVVPAYYNQKYQVCKCYSTSGAVAAVSPGCVAGLAIFTVATSGLVSPTVGTQELFSITHSGTTSRFDSHQ